MEEDNPPPWVCLTPIIMVGLGIAVAVIFAEVVPSEWQKSWKHIAYSKGILLESAIVFWCIGVVIRGKRLHCGGIVDSERSDRFKYGVLIPLLIIGLLFAGIGFVGAYEAFFVGSTVLTIIAACSEIGWGNPCYIVNGNWD